MLETRGNLVRNGEPAKMLLAISISLFECQTPVRKSFYLIGANVE